MCLSECYNARTDPFPADPFPADPFPVRTDPFPVLILSVIMGARRFRRLHVGFFSMNSENMVSVSLDREQIKKLKMEAVRGRSYWDRVSVAFAFRLLDTSDPYFDYFSVLDELDYMERIRPSSRTKAEQQFRKKPLHSLWHKHFFLAKHVPRNIVVRWNLNENGNRDLTNLLSEVTENYGENPYMWPNYLTHRLVTQGFEERAERGLTGDWIIFAKHDGMNFYLDLAIHEEGEECNADALLQRIRNGSHAEFPFLFE